MLLGAATLSTAPCPHPALSGNHAGNSYLQMEIEYSGMGNQHTERGKQIKRNISDLRLQDEHLFTFRKKKKTHHHQKNPPQYVGSFEFLKQIMEVVIEQSVYLEK